MLNRQELLEVLVDGDPREFSDYCVLNGVTVHTCSIRKMATMYAVLLCFPELAEDLRQKITLWLHGYQITLHINSMNRLEALSSPVWPGLLPIDPKLIESIR